MKNYFKVNAKVELSDECRDKVLANLLEAHHSTFYTVISVIQATCFGFLAMVCFEEGHNYTAYEWMLACNTLIIISLVWNGFIRGFVVLSYVPKLFDGVMPFALGAAQCFAIYFVAYGVRGWFWSIAALAIIGFIGYINGEINARLNPYENSHVMIFYGYHARSAQISTLLLAGACAAIAYFAPWSKETLVWISFPITASIAITDEILWLKLEKIARRPTSM